MAVVLVVDDDGSLAHAVPIITAATSPQRTPIQCMGAMLAPFAEIACAVGPQLSWFGMADSEQTPVEREDPSVIRPRALKGRVAIVTGGGTGIGLAIAKRLGELGATIVFGSRNSANLEQGSAELRRAGYDSLACQVDVRKPDQVDEMVHRTIHHYGHVDILVNNAAGNFICRAEELSPNGWNAVIGSVLNGSFYCSRAVGKQMIERGAGGSIVSVLANYVWTGSAGTVHSAAAKAGVMSMTQTLAVEWARHKIRVNAVAPGPIESPGAAQQLWNSPEAVARIAATVPLQRWGHASEVADAVAFLVSDHAAFITGETLTVDGGAWLGRGTYGFV